jgi:glyoxylase-like metal-dependent hydrolase (beta-lactamase superfamily II)
LGIELAIERLNDTRLLIRGGRAAGRKAYDVRLMPLTRRTFLATSTAAVAAGTFGGVRLFGQQPPAPVTPGIKALRGNAGIWTARGGTIGWLINPAGVIAVDSQFPDTAALCVEHLLKTSGKGAIAALINTHHHGDHTGGNATFRPKTKQIVAHANVPKYLKDGWNQQVARRAQQNPTPTTPAPPEPVGIDQTFTDAWSFDHGGETVSARHYGPAHTGGDAVIRFEKANVAHMGDLMFNRMHPFIDRANGASIANWIVVLQKVASELPADTLYIFGHAGPGHEVTGSRADLRHHAGYLSALLDYVRGQVKAGRTAEEVQASKDPLKGFDDYGPMVPRPLAAAFDEVTAGGTR